MKLPRRTFLHLAAAATALPTMPRVALALDYPTRPVHLIVGYPPGGVTDIVARLIAPWLSGAAWTIIRSREPAWRQQQHRHRSSRAGVAGWLHAPSDLFGERSQRDAVRKTQFRFHPRHRTDREHWARRLRDGGQPIVSGENRTRVHCLRQS